MGIFQNAFSGWFAKQAKARGFTSYEELRGAIQQILLGATYVGQSGSGVAPSLTYYDLVDCYKSWVAIAIDKIAKTIAMTELKLFIYQSGGKTLGKRETKAIRQKVRGGMSLKALGVEKVEVMDHPFYDLMMRPNNYQVRYTFWYETIQKLELSGSCLWYMVPNGLGLPVELYALPLTQTGQIRVVPDPRTIIKGYIYKDGDINETFDLNEVIYFRYPHPKSPFEGMSPLKAQIYPYNIDYYLSQMESYFLKNNAVAGLTLTTDQVLKEAQVQEIIAEVKAQWTDAKRGNPLMLHSGFKRDGTIQTQIGDVMSQNSIENARDKMLSGYDVPAGKVGIVKDVNRANIEVLNEMFTMETIKPKTMLIEEYIEAFMLPKWDDRLTCDFDLPQADKRKDDREERTANLEHYVTTVNEERAKMDLEPVPWGDQPWASFTQTPLGSMDVVASGEKHAPAIVTKGLAWTEQRKEMEWKTYLAEQVGWEGMMNRVMESVFAQQRDTVLTNLNNNSKRFEGMINGWSLKKVRQYMKANDPLVSMNIDKAEEAAMLRKQAEPVLKLIVQQAGQRRMGLLGDIEGKSHKALEIGIAFNANDPAVKKWLGDRLDRFSAEVTGTTFDQIDAVLRHGFGEGQPVTTIATTLSEKFASWEQYRAPLIARTESVAASNHADVEAVKQAGLEGKVLKHWLSSRDEHTRETHLQAELDYAGGIPIGEDFQVGDDMMDSPGNGSIAAENINCRCTVYYTGAEQQ